MSLKTKFKRFFELDDDYDEYQINEEVELPEEDSNGHFEPLDDNKTNNNVVSLSSVQQNAKVILLEPQHYEEAQEIADQLKNRKAVVINLQRISHDQAKRIVDFLSGTVYAIGGDIQKLGMNIFLCTPDNVDVSGAISDMFSSDNNNR
ncbi:cell division protein SepF [Texcoconibacillus texcoconensis]|uniref:Cell division protein SepF n=1 Tax=Texcoconibacillus texcoconensis TaxID=1095777 RepID=A0A840QLC2_9BACI|nr:cell division protein SepF [Texcoconibacillus texcoconensis]MBB5172158.1 cell division inhibitor SepF [Texcoconibacillus texcoconensis]